MITQAATDLEKCINLLRTPITVQDLPEAEDLDMKTDDVLAGRVGEVQFENVSFRYQGTERGSSGGLRNISFRIAPGKMLAFVGASGAGKRYVLLLSRFIIAFARTSGLLVTLVRRRVTSQPSAEIRRFLKWARFDSDRVLDFLSVYEHDTVPTETAQSFVCC